MKKPVWKESETFRPYSYIVDHIAKKDYKCKKCNANILTGQKYYEKKVMTPNYYFFSERYCEDCFNAFTQNKEEL